jgi:hypothetical protein
LFFFLVDIISIVRATSTGTEHRYHNIFYLSFWGLS